MRDKSWPLTKRIEIEWIDSCTHGRWESAEFHRENSSPTTCRTIGYIVASTPKKVVVAQSMSKDTGGVADTMAIPRSCVLSIKHIKDGFKS